MTFENFSEKFLNALEQEGLEIETKQVTKVNEELTGIYLKNKKEGIQVTTYLEKIHEAFEAGAPMEQLVKETANSLRHVDLTMADIPEFNLDNAKQRLYCTVINKEQNKKLIANVPHQDLHDLTLIARFKVFKNGSFVVDNNMCGQLKLTADEVMNIAKENTFADGYNCKPMSDVIKEMMIRDGIPPEFVDDMFFAYEDQMPVYVLTNKYSLNGATMMASKDILDEISKDLGENFYILPSSLHEVLLIPDSFADDVESLKYMVTEVNATVVSKEDKLSDNVYHYDSKTRTLTIAGKEHIITNKANIIGKGR